MEWRRVSRKDFEAILAEEIASLPSEMAEALSALRVPISEHSCFRDDTYRIEKVFVIASKGERLLFYDDVEEEFGVAVPGRDGVLTDWGTYGGLGAAVAALTADLRAEDTGSV